MSRGLKKRAASFEVMGAVELLTIPVSISWVSGVLSCFKGRAVGNEQRAMPNASSSKLASLEYWNMGKIGPLSPIAPNS